MIRFDKRHELKIPSNITREYFRNLLMSINKECKQNNYNNHKYFVFHDNKYNFDLNLIYEKQNMRIYNEKKLWYYKCYDHYCELLYDNNKNIDDTFIEQFDKIIVTEIEIYSLFIINYVIDKHKKIKIYSTDRNSKILFEEQDVTYISNIHDIDFSNKTCIIHSGIDFSKQYHQNRNTIISYNSKAVIDSLCWISNIKHPGKKHADQTFLVIDPICFTNGLVDIIFFTAVYVEISKRKKWIPIVYYGNCNNQYYDTGNMWEYYLCPVSRIKYEELQEFANVIYLSDNNIALCELGNIYVKEVADYLGARQFSFDSTLVFNMIHLNHITMQTIEKNIPKKFSGNKILGVMCRGTDLSFEATLDSNNANPYNMLELTILNMSQNKYDYVFLVTEDSFCLDIFKKHFKDKLLYIEQERVHYNYALNPYKPVSDILSAKNKKQLGYQYLSALYSLSICDKIISSTYCGAQRGMSLINQYKQIDYEVFDDDAIHKLILKNTKMNKNRPILQYKVCFLRNKWNDYSYCENTIAAQDFYIKAIKVFTDNQEIEIKYSFFINEYGWTEEYDNNTSIDNIKTDKDINGIMIYLPNNEYCIQYRALISDIWTNWKDGKDSIISNNKINGIQIKMVDYYDKN